MQHALEPGTAEPGVTTRETASRPSVAAEAERELAAAVATGDLPALGSLYDQHNAAVRSFARRLIGDEAAEDLVHDTFLALPNALSRYRGKGALRTFVMGVAVNQARHRLRSRSRFGAVLSRLSREPERAAQDPEELADRKRLAAMLRDALDGLSADHRVTFVLCEVEERSSPEVAQILGIPEATVRTRLHHAKRKLRAVLARKVLR